MLAIGVQRQGVREARLSCHLQAVQDRRPLALVVRQYPNMQAWVLLRQGLKLVAGAVGAAIHNDKNRAPLGTGLGHGFQHLWPRVVAGDDDKVRV